MPVQGSGDLGVSRPGRVEDDDLALVSGPDGVGDHGVEVVLGAQLLDAVAHRVLAQVGWEIEGATWLPSVFAVAPARDAGQLALGRGHPAGGLAAGGDDGDLIGRRPGREWRS